MAGDYEVTMHWSSEGLRIPSARQVRTAAQSLGGCHWGTFRLTDEPLHEPPALLNIALAEKGLMREAFDVLRLGETLRL